MLDQNSEQQATVKDTAAPVVASESPNVLNQAAELVSNKPIAAQPAVPMDEKIWAALGYIPMVALVSILIKPKSDYVKLHGRQGLLLFLLFIGTILLYVLLFPLGAVLGFLGQMFLMVVAVFSIYQAIIGNWWKIPVWGDFAEKIPVEKLIAITTEAVTGQQAATTQNDQSEVNNTPQK